MSEYSKPFPEMSEGAQPYWDACKEHRLILPECRACGELYFFPREFCPHCLSEDIQWIAASGKGRIHTYSIVERPASPSFLDDVPYAVAIIELEEGPRMMSNVCDIAPDKICVNMPVEVVFEDVSDSITLPKFRPLTNSVVDNY